MVRSPSQFPARAARWFTPARGRREVLRTNPRRRGAAGRHYRSSCRDRAPLSAVDLDVDAILPHRDVFTPFEGVLDAIDGAFGPGLPANLIGSFARAEPSLPLSGGTPGRSACRHAPGSAAIGDLSGETIRPALNNTCRFGDGVVSLAWRSPDRPSFSLPPSLSSEGQPSEHLQGDGVAFVAAPLTPACERSGAAGNIRGRAWQRRSADHPGCDPWTIGLCPSRHAPGSIRFSGRLQTSIPADTRIGGCRRESLSIAPEAISEHIEKGRGGTKKREGI